MNLILNRKLLVCLRQFLFLTKKKNANKKENPNSHQEYVLTKNMVQTRCLIK